jgi:hypothetical protein
MARRRHPSSRDVGAGSNRLLKIARLTSAGACRIAADTVGAETTRAIVSDLARLSECQHGQCQIGRRRQVCVVVEIADAEVDRRLGVLAVLPASRVARAVEPRRTLARRAAEPAICEIGRETTAECKTGQNGEGAQHQQPKLHEHWWYWHESFSQQTNIEGHQGCGLQVPAPSHRRQVVGSQLVVVGAKLPHAPLPVQVPAHRGSVPHAARPFTGALPLAVLVHVPGVTSQRVHCPLQSVLQQYPSLQLPPVHCALAPHVRPTGLVERHEVPLQ